MSNQGSPFTYWEENSRIHNLCPFYKVLSLIVVFLCLIFTNSVIDLGVCLLFVFVVIIFSDVSIRVVLRSLRMFKFIIFMLFFIFSLIYLNVLVGLGIALKFILFILYLSIISMCTSFYEMLSGVYTFLSPLSIFGNIDKLVLKITSWIKFFSVLYREDDRIKRSKMLRGVRFSNMKLIDRMDAFVNDFGPLCKVTIGKIRNLRASVYVKKYGISRFKYNYRLNKWGKTDTIMLVINVIIMIIVAIY